MDNAKMKISKIDKQIFKKSHIKLAYLFGSQAKGNAAKESDFDVAVLFEEEPVDSLALKEICSLSRELEKSFPAKLDIVSLHAASLLLKYEVVTHGKSIYCQDEAERINFEVSIIKEYIDEEPIRNLYNQALYKRILQGV
jgi:predicted nucleotidyltransferase